MNRPKLAPIDPILDAPAFRPFRRPRTATPRRARGRDWKAAHRPKSAFDRREV